MPRIYHPKSEAEWLALRAEDISSTSSAALFGLSPYMTEFQLYHAHRGTAELPFKPSERTRWGQRLERTIAEAIAEEYGVKVRALNAYMRHDTVERMGASFDFEIVGIAEGVHLGDEALRSMYQQHGPGILEIKNLDYLVFRDNWLREGDELEAPEHIEVQVQHQLEVIRREWACIGLLVGGNTLRLAVRERDAQVGERIGQYVTNFWRRLAAGYEPDPDYSRDGKVIAALYPETAAGKHLDLTDSNRLGELARLYKEGSDLEKNGKEQKEAAAAEIRHIIGDAEKVRAPGGFSISTFQTKETVVTQTRKAGRQMRINPPKAA